MDFTGKVAVATGAASGMGLLFSQNFASLGGNVVMCDVNEIVLHEKVEEINSKGKGKAIGVICDVRDYTQVCNTRDKAVAAFGRIDVLVNNAGITRDNLLVTMEDAEKASETINMLMGEDVGPRREFIEKNATYAKIDA